MPLPGRDPLMVKVIKTSRVYRTEDGETPYYGFYAYWFVGQARETSSHYARMFWLAWDRVINSQANRWAYIAVSGERDSENNDFEEYIISFIQEVYPEVLTDAFRNRVYAKK